ncbi:hypothetical protein PAXRUDRAFT_170415 [Paxillus rubicundulus Ve08.2h10]|uniref:Uncharacterized protein n=1 Tax=Paxillus rubicundulus Ve08.2h10 TaxID=930991 RepID=A0A0D0D7K3_9AGAM|nr:hypothetical protein PAXRUDRAFT_170415 [Paxillus rubicundulus Ve08.2h10]
MDRCWMEVKIDLNVVGVVSDPRNILAHFPQENQPGMCHIFWCHIHTLMDATTSLIGNATLLGITPTWHPIL